MSKKKSARKLKMPSWKARKERGPTYFYYRTRIFLVSLGLAVITTGFIPRGLGIWGIELMSFLGSFSGFVVLGDVLVYKILKRKESECINPEELMKWDFITPDQLDSFIKKMSNVRITTFAISMVLFAITGFSIEHLGKILFATFVARTAVTMWLIIRKKLAIPLSYPVSFEGNSQGRRRFEFVSKNHNVPIYTMDNAFYAGTGVITYRPK